MRIGSAWRSRAGDTAVAVAALGAAWALKAFYSRAGADDVRWVLAPTVRLVEWTTGATFEYEAHQGYLSRDHLYAIVPACAGINFLIVAFCSLCLGLTHTCRGILARVALVAASALAAYATTLVANAARIALALPLHDAGAAWGPLTPDRVHCAEGVIVYCLCLGLLFATATRVTGARHDFAL